MGVWVNHGEGRCTSQKMRQGSWNGTCFGRNETCCRCIQIYGRLEGFPEKSFGALFGLVSYNGPWWIDFLYKSVTDFSQKSVEVFGYFWLLIQDFQDHFLCGWNRFFYISHETKPWLFRVYRGLYMWGLYINHYKDPSWRTSISRESLRPVFLLRLISRIDESI